MDTAVSRSTVIHKAPNVASDSEGRCLALIVLVGAAGTASAAGEKLE